MRLQWTLPKHLIMLRGPAAEITVDEGGRRSMPDFIAVEADLISGRVGLAIDELALVRLRRVDDDGYAWESLTEVKAGRFEMKVPRGRFQIDLSPRVKIDPKSLAATQQKLWRMRHHLRVAQRDFDSDSGGVDLEPVD